MFPIVSQRAATASEAAGQPQVLSQLQEASHTPDTVTHWCDKAGSQWWIVFEGNFKHHLKTLSNKGYL